MSASLVAQTAILSGWSVVQGRQISNQLEFSLARPGVCVRPEILFTVYTKMISCSKEEPVYTKTIGHSKKELCYLLNANKCMYIVYFLEL